MSVAFSQTAAACPECNGALNSSALSCARCGWLRHSAELEQLAQQAQTAAQAGDLTGARDFWRKAAQLLPENTVQYRSVQARIDDLSRQIDAAGASKTGWKKGATGAGSAALLLLSKGKLLLLGLTKLSTLLSMFAFFGVYWTLYGWAFALGLVLSIYVHEMGHVSALRRYGIPATAPMFIPGFGAFIGMRAASLDPVQESRVGLAGPLYGLAAAALCLAVQPLTGSPTMGAIAHTAAVINLFNLIPVWQLDGSRGLRSLTRGQRAMLLVVALGLWAITSQGMLLLIALGLVYRLFTKDQVEQGDDIGVMQYAGLLVTLTAVAVLAARLMAAAASAIQH
jgi:Zn-dependent protease